MAASIRLALLLLAEAAVAFATLSFELTAARLVAPFAGLSTDTWVAIIAAFLAALALGNVAGGTIASRFEPRRGLHAAAVASVAGAAAIAVVPILLPLWSAVLLASPPFGLARLGAFAAFPFMPAGFLLGVATPLLAAAAIAGVERTGRVIGLFYAAGAGGSFVGALATLWVLHDRFGLRITVAALAIGLIVNAALILGLAQPERARA